MQRHASHDMPPSLQLLKAVLSLDLALSSEYTIFSPGNLLALHVYGCGALSSICGKISV